MGKIVAIAFKTVLLTISVFLSIYSLSLLGVIEHTLVNNFFGIMDTIRLTDAELNSLTDICALDYVARIIQMYTFYGLSHLSFMIVK